MTPPRTRRYWTQGQCRSGLHYHNVHAIAAIPQIVELNISHAIVATRYCRFRGAVREMKALMHQARKP